MTQTEAKWTERVRGWQASGRTAEQFAEGQGFKASTLRFWASRLRTTARPVAAPSIPKGEPAGFQLVRVRRARGGASPIVGNVSTTATTSSSAPIVITLGAARIEVRAGFDHRLLGEIIAALGDTR